MKIKSGFITNSSSSNYTVFLKKTFSDSLMKKHPLIRIMYNFFIESFNCLKDGNQVTNREQLELFYIQTYGGYKDRTLEDIFKDDEELELRFNNALALLENGYIMLEKSFSCDDEKIEAYFREIGDGVNIIVEN